MGHESKACAGFSVSGLMQWVADTGRGEMLWVLFRGERLIVSCLAEGLRGERNESIVCVSSICCGSKAQGLSIVI